MPLHLHYFHDPMCSWCWAFRPLWHDIVASLPEDVMIHRVLGGLAADTDQPMPGEMQAKIIAIWQNIQQVVPGTSFNFDFWEKCTPRRSTFPACRAVIAARKQDPEKEEAMILAIQQAYYLEAKNPSDLNTLVKLAKKIDLNHELFIADMSSSAVNQELLHEIEFTRKLNVKSFPTLLLENKGIFINLKHDYLDVESVLHQVKAFS